ncbi:hypothetical protein NMG60_11023718 [Bertholletia excelsa]
MEGEKGGENDRVMLAAGEETQQTTLREEEEEKDEDEDEETLKKRISSHPMYGLLVKTHLNCLKVLYEVGLVDFGAVGLTTGQSQVDSELHVNPRSSSDLDKFMEDYCKALSKLKEAMEKPLQETATFIDTMYDQLDELGAPSEPTSSLQ